MKQKKYKVLVIGRSGQVATELDSLSRSASVDVRCLGRTDIAMTDAAAVSAAIQEHGAQLVINAAAYTAVDQAETDAEAAYEINATGAACVARACHETEVPLIHLSTDYVYDGTGLVPYQESETLRPASVYGRSKAEGDQAVAGMLTEHVIVRTSWVYAEHGRNFVRTMLALARQGHPVTVVDDQYGCPTWARDIASALLCIARQIIEGRKHWGTYHYCGQGSTSWHGFAAEIFTQARHHGIPIPALSPIGTAEYRAPANSRVTAPRPAYSVLDCRRIEQVWRVKPRPWQESLGDCISAMLIHAQAAE